MLNPESDLYQALDHSGLCDLLETIASVDLEINGGSECAQIEFWRWIVKLEDDTYAYIIAGCSMFGWDDESAYCEVVDTAENRDELLKIVDEDYRAVFEEMLEDEDTQRTVLDL